MKSHIAVVLSERIAFQGRTFSFFVKEQDSLWFGT